MDYEETTDGVTGKQNYDAEAAKVPRNIAKIQLDWAPFATAPFIAVCGIGGMLWPQTMAMTNRIII